MTDEEIKHFIKLTVKESVKEYKKNGLLKDNSAAAYSDAAEILASYYRNNKADTSITYAIQAQRFDPYYRIIPLYFEQGKTIEQIAGVLGVDVSTVIRNKKRLCLAIYNDIT